MRGAADLVPLLARRESLLDALAEGARPKSDIVGELDVSRSTVDRSVRELESAGVLERRNGGFGLTLAGRLVFEEYRAFRACCEDVASAEGVLSPLGPDVDLSPAMLAGAEVVQAERTSPYRPAERFLDVLSGAEAARALSTAVGPNYVDVVERFVVDEGLEYAVGATPSVVDRLVSDFRESLERVLATDRFTLRELADAPPFSLAVLDRGADRSVAMLVYADEGVRGYVGNDEAAAVAWAEAQFDRYWADATPISPPPSEG